MNIASQSPIGVTAGREGPPPTPIMDPHQLLEKVTLKPLLLCGALALVAMPSFAADVGVSINLGEPGFFGQINIGNVPPPAMIYAQPVLVERAPEYADAPPIYLHVPPGHEKHWDRHCREYNACGRRVYFVRDDWYQNEYVPRYRRDGGRDYNEHRDDRDRHHDRRDDRDDDRGHHGGDHGDHDHEHGDHHD